MRLTLYLTSYCPFTKGYCFDHVGCSPDNIQSIYDDAEGYIHEAKKYDFDTISFSGGEPTYDLTKLINLITFSKDLGFSVRIKTSAYWGDGYNEYIIGLYNAGLDYIRVFFDSNRKYTNEKQMFIILRAIADKFTDRNFRIIVPRGDINYDLLSEIAIVERLPYPDSDYEFKETVSGIDDVTLLPATEIVRAKDYKFAIFWNKKVYTNGEGIVKDKHTVSNDRYIGDLNINNFNELYTLFLSNIK